MPLGHSVLRGGPGAVARAPDARAGGRRVALEDVSRAVSPGEVVGISGPSGSGKSALLHLFAALDTPTAGTAVVASDVPGHVPHLLRLLDDAGERRELAAEGRRRAKQYSWDRAAARTEEIYRELAGDADRASIDEIRAVGLRGNRFSPVHSANEQLGGDVVRRARVRVAAANLTMRTVAERFPDRAPPSGRSKPAAAGTHRGETHDRRHRPD